MDAADAGGGGGEEEEGLDEQDITEAVQESFPTLLRALRGRDHLVKLLVLQAADQGRQPPAPDEADGGQHCNKDVMHREKDAGDEEEASKEGVESAVPGVSGDGASAPGIVEADGALAEGPGKVLVEEIVKRFAKIPEVMLLTGGRPGVEMTCGQLWDAERKRLGLSQVKSALKQILDPRPSTLWCLDPMCT